jgi:DNA-binding MarR family transcriptional regulator
MVTQSSEESAQELLAALVRIVTAWSSVEIQGRIAGQVGVSVSESDVRGLYTLGLMEAPVRPARLAAELQLTRPTTSKMIARLTDAGLVERTGVTRDGRGALIGLTATGREAHRRLVGAGQVIVHAALEGVSPTEARAMIGVVQRIIERVSPATDEVVASGN